jgi:4-diphosphocytidyl-2-C-methyl-D-erythritol kinase
VIVFPNCKINLGLCILRKRSDGYHDLETIFYPIPLTDVLEVTEYKNSVRSQTIPINITGIKIEDDSSDNLCIKAYKLLKRDFPELPHVQMQLHKTIPSGAGLGGGSSDGAFTLQLLNEKFKLGLSKEELIEYASQLGSDCPFFIINKPCFATGRGGSLEPVELDLSGYKFVIVNPGIHVNTGRAFLDMKPAVPDRSIKAIILGPIERWKDDLSNDFEKHLFRKHKEIVDIKDRLYISGAVYASMSGSGSTVYGIFPKEKEVSLSFPEHYFMKEIQ